MPATATPARPAPPAPSLARRSPAQRALFLVLAFQGLSGLLGGGMLFAQTVGAGAFFPDEWLGRIPFDSWLWPGVILGGGLGVNALVLAYGIRRLPRWRGLLFVERVTGQHWSWAGSLGLGVALMAWIVVQRLLIPGTTWLQPFYFSVGAAIAALTLTRSVRANLRASD